MRLAMPPPVRIRPPKAARRSKPAVERPKRGPSGNAPELRCYVEGMTAERAEILLRWGMDAANLELGT